MNHSLFISINSVLSKIREKNILTYPKPYIKIFDTFTSDRHFKNIKLVILNIEPNNRPDSSGLFCFYDESFKCKKSNEIINSELLLDNNFNTLQDYYIDEGVFFMNIALTISPDESLNDLKTWEDITSKILREITKGQQPIIISVGGKTTYNFAYNNSFRPLNINNFIDNNVPLEHLPLDHTYIIECGNIKDNEKDFKSVYNTLKPKNLINELLQHKNIKKINWL